MKRQNFWRCIFALPTRQAMTFTNLCGDRCNGIGLIDMIIVML